jgi:outer membrane protein assembly factor BamB
MGREANDTETCLSFDANTGKRLWRQPYTSTFQAPDNRAGKGPNSTPTVDGDRVYMLGLGGMFTCLNTKSGKILWQHNFAKEFWGVVKSKDEMDEWFPVCGASASALVEGNRIIIPVGGRKGGSFAAFDRNSGKQLWGVLDERSSYASPIFADLGGARQMVGFTGTRMVGMRYADRKVMWDFPFKALFEQTIISPIIWKDHVIIGGEARPTVCLKISGSGDAVKKDIVWQSAELSSYMVTPVVFKDHLVGLDMRSRRLTCLDLATGKTKWQSTQRFPSYLSLIVAGDTLLALLENGELVALEANTEKMVEKARWKVSEAGGTWAHLAITGSRLYIKDKEHLLCYDLGA